MTLLISTGLPTLDRLIGGGLRPGTLTVVAGRSQAGMTTMLDTICCAAAFRAGVPTVLADLETSTTDRLRRLSSALSGVPLHAVQRWQLTAEEAATVRRSDALAAGAPFWFSEESTVAGLGRVVRRTDPPARLLLVDGMRLLPSGGPGEVAVALLGLAALAGIAVVASTPLPSVTERPVPGLGDLPAGMGMSAHNSLLLYRPDLDGDDSRPGEVEVIVAATRHGITGRFVVAADFNRARLAEPVPTPAVP